MDRDRLTDRNHWQSVWEANPSAEPAVAQKSRSRSRLARWLCKAGGIESLDATYADEQFWKVLLPKYLSYNSSAKLIEIGAAPGTWLVALNKRFGYIPYGVEYTSSGAAQARRTLGDAGFPAENIFECDAFSDEFQEKYKGHFDVIWSGGFIEHFTEVESVVQHHINLLAPGGILVVRIPRLVGINYLLARVIEPECLPLHNLTIMWRKRFLSLFPDSQLQRLHGDYQGSLHLLVADNPRGRMLGKMMLWVARRAQIFVTIALFRLLGGRSLESAALSPHLLYVGKKL